MAENIFNFFGWQLSKTAKEENKDKDKSPSIVPPTDEDGAGYITSTGSAHYGQYVDIDGDKAKDISQLIFKYRGASMHPDIDMALEEILNESIVYNQDEQAVSLVLDNIDDKNLSKKLKEAITKEFDEIVSMLNFHENGADMFKRWYVDGRLIHHIVINEKRPKEGILEVRFMDAAKVRKIREIKHKKDERTGVKVVDEIKEYYIYQEKPGAMNQGIKLTNDSVSYVTSGLLDETRSKVVSHLHKALKPVNQLRMMEDSLVIYRLARAPERRIFYIDVGNMPKGKAEEYMKNIRANYRNKLVYNSDTGEMRDDRKHMTMLEDFWLPRKEGGRGTEITSLPGGDNLGQIEDVIYFQKRLYRALNVPLNRLEQESQFNIGRSNEVTREEIKFQKFIDKVRRKFSKLFLGLLKKQLIMKQIILEEDWDKWKNDIIVDYLRDNHHSELIEGEILKERLATLDQVDPYVGKWFTTEYVHKKILRYKDDDIKALEKEAKEHDQEQADMGMEKSPGAGHYLPDEEGEEDPKGVKKKPEPKKEEVDHNLQRLMEMGPITRGGDDERN